MLPSVALGPVIARTPPHEGNNVSKRGAQLLVTRPHVLVDSGSENHWMRLSAAARPEESAQAHGVSEAAWPAVLSLDVWGRLLGGLERTCQRTMVPSPLVAYCRRLPHAPPDAAAAAAVVLRPLVAALEARVALEDAEQSSDEASSDGSGESDGSEDEESEGGADDDDEGSIEALGRRADAVVAGMEVIGLFPRLGRAKHSCAPTCQLEAALDGEGGRFGVRAALRWVAPAGAEGAELTVSHVDGDGDRDERCAALGYDCACARCVCEQRLEQLDPSGPQVKTVHVQCLESFPRHPYLATAI